MGEDIVVAPSISTTGKLLNTTDEKCSLEDCGEIATHKLERMVLFGRSGRHQGVRCEKHKSIFFF